MDTTHRLKTFLAVFIWSFVCFGLQFNLNSIFSFIHAGGDVAKITPYFYFGCALAPLVLWVLRFHKKDFCLPWLPPLILFAGAFALPLICNPSFSKIFLILALATTYSNLLVHIFKERFIWTYWLDLLGGVFALLLCTTLLPLLSGEGIYLGLFCLSLLPGLFLAQRRVDQILRWLLLGFGVVLFILQVTSQTLDLIQFLPSRTFHESDDFYGSSVLKNQDAHLLASRWSAISRVDIIQTRAREKRPLLYYNNRPMSPVDTGAENLETRKYSYLDPIFQNAKTALVLGPAGGNNLEELLRVGVRDVQGVELNEATVELMKGPLLGLSKEIYLRAPVTVSEGRAYLEATSKKFDLILLDHVGLLTTTFDTNVLLTSNLYTQQAIQTYFDHLNPGGVIMIGRHLWEDVDLSPDTIRLLYTIGSFLDSNGLKITDHLAVFSTRFDRGIYSPKRLSFLLYKDSHNMDLDKQIYTRLQNVNWLSDPQITATDAETYSSEEELHSIYKSISEHPTTDSSLITTDSHPYHYFAGSQNAIQEIIGPTWSLPFFGCLLVMMLILFIVRSGIQSGSGAAEWKACRKALFLALASGISYGVLIPFFYLHFLVYARVPLTTIGLIQLGSLAAGILGNFAAPKIGRTTLLLTFGLSMALLAFLEFAGTQFFGALRLGENSYDTAIFIISVLTTFSLGSVFPQVMAWTASLNPKNKTTISEALFGINIAGLGMGAFLSFFANLLWGLRVSYAILSVLLVLIFFTQFFNSRLKRVG